MTRRRSVCMVASVAAATVMLAGACGNDDGNPAEPSPLPPAATTRTSPPPATATAPGDLAAATAEVETNWARFFHPRTPVKERTALLKDGEQLAPMVAAFAAHPRYGQAQAEVEQVVFATATTADVTYTLSLPGRALPSILGNAVLEDGTWKVSVPTFCARAQVAGDIALADRCR
ncbi:hypothetical protein ACFPH6_22820 [Streptomyces xiangluensis]|uniref:Low molecular weight antigen MTB12-like C-terminal domain-containing protein n=1 Tax=Streptomyces xiangluensis TaxID=2665720 RepID=A0ABV8YS76_9ACTN